MNLSNKNDKIYTESERDTCKYKCNGFKYKDFRYNGFKGTEIKYDTKESRSREPSPLGIKVPYYSQLSSSSNNNDDKWLTSHSPSSYSHSSPNRDNKRTNYVKSNHRRNLSYYKTEEDDVAYVKKVQDIDWEQTKPMRGGVIIYTEINNNIYFCLGIDTKSGDLTDFGGGISYKKDLTALNGGMREFKEESLKVFDEITLEQLNEGIVVYSKFIMIVFIKIFVSSLDELITTSRKFLKLSKITRNPEIVELIWLNSFDFLDIIKHGCIKVPKEYHNYELNTLIKSDRYNPNGVRKLYTRVRKLLNNVSYILLPILYPNTLAVSV